MFAFLAPVRTVETVASDVEDPKQLVIVIAVALGVAVALLVVIGLLRRFLFVCRPNELLVVAGKKHRLPSGESANYTVIQAGSHWRVPFVQSVTRMDIRLVPIELLGDQGALERRHPARRPRHREHQAHEQPAVHLQRGRALPRPSTPRRST